MQRVDLSALPPRYQQQAIEKLRKQVGQIPRECRSKYGAQEDNRGKLRFDSKKEAWEKGVKDLNITWTQLSDLQGWKNAGAKLYGVNSIPHTVLVDKDGTIIAKGLHGKEIGEKLAEMLK